MTTTRPQTRSAPDNDRAPVRKKSAKRRRPGSTKARATGGPDRDAANVAPTPTAPRRRFDVSSIAVGLVALGMAARLLAGGSLGRLPNRVAAAPRPTVVAATTAEDAGQPYVGVGVGPLTSVDDARSTNQVGTAGPATPAGVDHGALVGQVDPNGPADEAGLRPGDVVIGFDGRDVSGAEDFAQDLAAHRSGDRVSLEVVRGDQHLSLAVTVGAAPVH